MSSTQRFDLYSHDFRLTTHATYARMREESPVHLQPGLDGETPIWFVTRYDDVVALLTDNEHFVLAQHWRLLPTRSPNARRRARSSRTRASTRTCCRRTATTIVACVAS